MQSAQTAGQRAAHSTAWCAARQETCWGGVRVDTVNVIQTPAGRRVHAVIQLGGLEPADVQVQLEAEGEPGTQPPATNGRMSSMQSYDNGAFVFESAPLPADSPALTEWRMRVRARDSRDAAPVECRIPLLHA